MGLSSPGIGSGLDIKGMVDAMVKADIASIQSRHDKKLEKTNTELSAVGQLKSALSTLGDTLSALSNMSQFYKMKSSISQPGFFTAAVSDQASSGVYQIQVEALAQAQNLSSGYYTNSTDPVGAGTITINFGTYSNDLSSFTVNPDATPVTITIAPGNDSLIAVCEAINQSESGVTASIVQDGTGSRLSITSKTGLDYAMQITSTIPTLNYDPTTANTTLTQNMAAQNSLVKINGISVSQNTNQLKDVLTGISLSLVEAEPGKPINLNVEKNKDLLTTCVNEFIKKYNDCMTFLNNVTGYDKATQKGGFFQGDAQVKSLKHDLYQTVAGFLTTANNSGLTLDDIGIKTTKNSLLTLDQKTFDDAVANNFDAIGALFAKSIKTTDANIQVKSIDTKAAAGAYDINLSEYTPGVSMTGTIGGFAATSTDGFVLTGSGKLSSLSVNVLSGGTGPRGQIIVEDGLAVLMKNVVDAYIGKKGEFEERTESLNKELNTLAQDQQKIDARSQFLEKRYLQQWNGVDLLISRLQDTSSMLTQVLSSLPKLKIKD